MNDPSGRAQPTVDSASAGQMVPGCIRKKAEQAMRKKLLGSIPL